MCEQALFRASLNGLERAVFVYGAGLVVSTGEDGRVSGDIFLFDVEITLFWLG